MRSSGWQKRGLLARVNEGGLQLILNGINARSVPNCLSMGQAVWDRPGIDLALITIIIIIIIIIAYRYGIMATAVAILGALRPIMYLATALFQNTLSQQF